MGDGVGANHTALSPGEEVRLTGALGRRAAAAAAVIAVFVWTAIHGGPAAKEAAQPPATDRVAAGGNGAEAAPEVRVTHQSRNYDEASIRRLPVRLRVG